MRVCPQVVRAVMILVAFCVQGYSQFSGFNPNDPWYTPDFHITLDVPRATAQDVQRAVWRIDYFALQNCLNHLEGHGILPVQVYGRRPPRWIFLHLIGDDGDRITLAIRGDNLYVAAIYINNQWFVFRNRAGDRLIRPATVLRFGDDYGTLVGGHRNLADLRLSKASVLQAIRFLARYQRPEFDNIDEGHIKRSVAVLLVTFVEAVRFTEIGDAVVAGWEFGVNLTPRQARYVVKWKDISCALMIARQNNDQWGTNVPGDETAGLKDDVQIYDMAGALAVINVLLRPNQCSAPINWLV